MGTTTVQLLAALMAVAHGLTWLVWWRWERPGRSAALRARIGPPPLLARGSGLVQITPLVYPVLVVASPRWGYDSWLNWSSGLDPLLQAVGVGIWLVGVSVLLWAAWTMGWYTAVDGLAVDHELVTDGPYRYVRHPVYASFTAIAVATALIFRSYLLVAVAVAWVTTTRWWAAAEEALLASAEGFGDVYRGYADRTGRFLPRLGRTRG